MLRVASTPIRHADSAAPSRAVGEALHLLVEAMHADPPPGGRRASPSRGAAKRELPSLALPPGPIVFDLDRLQPASREGGLLPGSWVQFEVLHGARGPQLLVVADSVAAPRLSWNGAIMPAIAVLGVGDQLLVDYRTRLHATTYVDGAALVAGPEHPELLGRACGLCRLTLEPGHRVVVCPCGIPLHVDGDGDELTGELDCARLGACPSCESPVRLDAGYTWLPEVAS